MSASTVEQVNQFREAHGQLSYSLRMEWGPTGADAVTSGCDVAAVVDVLSFTTTLTVAADRGTVVYPYPWHGDGGATTWRAQQPAARGRRGATPCQAGRVSV